MAFSSYGDIESIAGKMSDGVVLIDGCGVVSYINAGARRILGLHGQVVGSDWRSLIASGDQKKIRDMYHGGGCAGVSGDCHGGGCAGVSGDCHGGGCSGEAGVLNKNSIFAAVPPCSDRSFVYTCPDGSRKNLRISALSTGEGGDGGTVLRVLDETELVRMRLMQREAMLVYVSVTLFLCAGIFLYVIWELLGRPYEGSLLTRFIELGGLFTFLFVARDTGFLLSIGALRIKGIKKAVLVDAVIAAAGLALLVLIKLVLLKTSPGLFPPGARFWEWGTPDPSRIFYPVTVVVQEFLARGALHENLLRVFTGKKKEGLAIVVSSLIFSVLHIHKGLVYMICAAVLLGALGFLYRRQRTIWGLCIPHYVLGMAVGFLGFA